MLWLLHGERNHRWARQDDLREPDLVRGPRSPRGFTLVELLVSMSISVIVLGSLTLTFISQRKTYDIQKQITEALQTARAAMDMMHREVRLAGYDPTESGFDGIPYSTTQLQVLADLTSDGDTSDSNEDITYAHFDATDQIKRSTGGGFQPFAENVYDFTFALLDTNDNAATYAEDIRKVKLTITVRTEDPDPDYTSNGGYRTVSLASYVTPRNLKY